MMLCEAQTGGKVIEYEVSCEDRCRPRNAEVAGMWVSKPSQNKPDMGINQLMPYGPTMNCVADPWIPEPQTDDQNKMAIVVH
jgi:hypothetical protein